MVDLVYGKLDEATRLRAIGSFPGGRAISGLKDGLPSERGEQVTAAPPAETASKPEENWVLGPGIEPGTRGFSIRASKDANKAKVLRFLKMGYVA